MISFMIKHVIFSICIIFSVPTLTFYQSIHHIFGENFWTILYKYLATINWLCHILVLLLDFSSSKNVWWCAGSVYSQIQWRHDSWICNPHHSELFPISSNYDLFSTPHKWPSRATNESVVSWHCNFCGSHHLQLLPPLSSIQLKERGWKRVQDSKGWPFWACDLPPLPLWDHCVLWNLLHFSDTIRILFRYRH